MRKNMEAASAAFVGVGGMAAVVALSVMGAAWWTIPIVLVFAFLVIIAIYSA